MVELAKSGLSCWSFPGELGYMSPVLLTQEIIGLEIRATWWVRWSLPLSAIKGQTSHLTLHNSPWLGCWTLPSGSWPSGLPYGTCPQTRWHFMAPNYLHWMAVHQESHQPPPSWNSSVGQSCLFDCDDMKSGSKHVSGLCHPETEQCWWQSDSQARGKTVSWSGAFSHEGGRLRCRVCKMRSITWTKARWVPILAASPLGRIPSLG